ncbi:glutamate racemase [Clostridium estertheticum]|uniref:Glutamate racemase n=2 Tax=Clostridium estertheticum TaxID=238834 RepID=A0A1J0GMD4_9CLOT|nr:glutamate racemase [Clostridium estertheticum]APC42423.1 glutamate racemase [Clostridium estertheticum subsp. estertheticum]MBU3075338.1 glutamate racemase [Clostridium estertheticum]MBU3164891.1 glutamate racemase [Clostridium estertheticum]MBU3187063.1 glutamate racemase [Clostridium estertheticum]MBZ9615637.1 glutamate racemase [Clostridium estertheticum subsp. laramiense]
MNNRERPIGFFDSGVGGISVLKESLKVLPNEDFVYFGDSLNAPYGIKNVNEVRKLTFKAVDFLLEKGVKVVVIACNTATSAAIDALRRRYKDIPIIGIEPALKPAVEVSRGKSVIIMATPMTLTEKKFDNLMKLYNKEVDIIPLPCAGLVELIENGIIDGDEINEYLKGKLKEFSHLDVAAIVLGCTHYPFIKKELIKIVGEKTIIIDGSIGTVNQLKRQLTSNNLLNEKTKKGIVTIYSSSTNDNTIDLSYKLLKL